MYRQHHTAQRLEQLEAAFSNIPQNLP
jgi:hypothetical protein